MTRIPPPRTLVREPENLARLQTLRVPTVGHLPHKTEWVMRPLGCDAIGIVLRGGGFFRSGARGTRRPVAAPFFFYVRAGQPIQYGPAPEAGWEERFLTFQGARVEEWKAMGWLPTQRCVFALEGAPEVAAWHQAIIEDLGAADPWRVDRAKLAAERLVMELAHQAREAMEPAGRFAKLERQARDWRRHPEQAVDFVECARRCALSYSRFRQLFRARFGAAPYRYLLGLRIDRACRLLADRERAIKEIAFACGFDYVESFNRAFQGVKGQSPTQYRHEAASWLGGAREG